MTYAPHANHRVPPPGTFVLRRHPTQEGLAKKGLKQAFISPFLSLFSIAVSLGSLIMTAVTAPMFLFGDGLVFFLVAAAFFALGVGGAVWTMLRLVKARRVENALSGLELWISPEGVTYACVTGVFSAPWSSLRRMYFSDRVGLARTSPPGLFVEVAGWGGPLAEFEKPKKPCKLRMPLNLLGVDPATIARAAYEISSGRVTVAAR